MDHVMIKHGHHCHNWCETEVISQGMLDTNYSLSRSYNCWGFRDSYIYYVEWYPLAANAGSYSAYRSGIPYCSSPVIFDGHSWQLDHGAPNATVTQLCRAVWQVVETEAAQLWSCGGLL